VIWKLRRRRRMWRKWMRKRRPEAGEEAKSEEPLVRRKRSTPR
jgi:hypothetical protein